MATSSIIDNIRVNNPRVLEEYVKALEESAEHYDPQKDERRSNVCTDPEITREFMKKSLARHGIQL